MLEGSRGHVKPTFSEKSEKVLPPNEVIKVERGPKKGRKRMKEWGEVTFMKEWVKALSERSILAPADLRYLFSFPRYRNLKMHSWSIQIYNSNILPLLNAWFEACFSGPNKPLLTQWNRVLWLIPARNLISNTRGRAAGSEGLLYHAQKG